MKLQGFQNASCRRHSWLSLKGNDIKMTILNYTGFQGRVPVWIGSNKVPSLIQIMLVWLGPNKYDSPW